MEGELVILDGGSAFSKKLTELLAAAPDFAWDVRCPEGQEEEKAILEAAAPAFPGDGYFRLFLFGSVSTASGTGKLPALFLSEKKEECGEESFRIYRYCAFSQIKEELARKAGKLKKATVEKAGMWMQE